MPLGAIGYLDDNDGNAYWFGLSRVTTNGAASDRPAPLASDHMTDFTNTLVMVRRRMEEATRLGAKEIWLALDEAANLVTAVDDAQAEASEAERALDLNIIELERVRAMAKDLVGVRT